jgi:hypothetical protein
MIFPVVVRDKIIKYTITSPASQAKLIGSYCFFNGNTTNTLLHLLFKHNPPHYSINNTKDTRRCFFNCSATARFIRVTIKKQNRYQFYCPENGASKFRNRPWQKYAKQTILHFLLIQLLGCCTPANGQISRHFKRNVTLTILLDCGVGSESAVNIPAGKDKEHYLFIIA